MISSSIFKVMPLWIFTQKPIPWIFSLFLVFSSSVGRSRRVIVRNFHRNSMPRGVHVHLPEFSILQRAYIVRNFLEILCHVAGACASRWRPSRRQKKKKKKLSILKKRLKPSQMKMFFKSNQRSMQMKKQRTSQYMVFSTFKETVLLLLSLKVRTLNDGRIMLFFASRSKLRDSGEVCHVYSIVWGRFFTREFYYDSNTQWESINTPISANE